MVPTTQPEDIASYAWRVASTWKIGRRDVGDGVLLIVAKDDRRMRIEVAKKLEGALPDLAVARVIDTAMKPKFVPTTTRAACSRRSTKSPPESTAKPCPAWCRKGAPPLTRAALTG